jgi:hypothetical protein
MSNKLNANSSYYDYRFASAVFGYRVSGLKLNKRERARQLVLSLWYRFKGAQKFRVLYPDGLVSAPGDYTFARNYAAIFGGKIVLDTYGR